MELKYVIIDHVHPIVFAPTFSHDKMTVHGNVTSAAFVQFSAGDNAVLGVEVYGRSFSLDLDPDPADARLLQAYFESY